MAARVAGSVLLYFHQPTQSGETCSDDSASWPTAGTHTHLHTVLQFAATVLVFALLHSLCSGQDRMDDGSIVLVHGSVTVIYYLAYFG